MTFRDKVVKNWKAKSEKICQSDLKVNGKILTRGNAQVKTFYELFI
nr:MAG TPA: hypothetical protein [Caudoviricetes sp.]